MSTIITTAEPFAYHGSHKSRSYVTIGEPLRGNVHLGRVLYYSTHNGPLRWITTEKTCNKEDQEHDMSFDSNGILSCDECQLIVEPEPTHTFGFTRTYNDRTGEIGYVVEPYFDLLHGPHGAESTDQATIHAEKLLALLHKREGSGPWFMMPDQDGELHVRTASIIRASKAWDEGTGPFSDVRDARKALNERILARRFARTFQE